MSERPILFSGAMVRAILHGRKTQTRRPAKSERAPEPGHAWQDCLCREIDPSDTPCVMCRERFGSCPYGAPGDLLWVREMHQIATGHMYDGEAAVRYAADGAIRAVTDDERSNAAPRSRSLSGRWRPSIHMPRWASRLTLRVVSVRVERVRSITYDDAIAEGMTGPDPWHEYGDLWDSINGARAPWASNPWVWVVTFSRVEVG